MLPVLWLPLVALTVVFLCQQAANAQQLSPLAGQGIPNIATTVRVHPFDRKNHVNRLGLTLSRQPKRKLTAPVSVFSCRKSISTFSLIGYWMLMQNNICTSRSYWSACHGGTLLHAARSRQTLWQLGLGITLVLFHVGTML